MTLRNACWILTALAVLLALASVTTYLISFERIESSSGLLGLGAFGLAMLVLALRRRMEAR